MRQDQREWFDKGYDEALLDMYQMLTLSSSCLDWDTEHYRRLSSLVDQVQAKQNEMELVSV